MSIHDIIGYFLDILEIVIMIGIFIYYKVIGVEKVHLKKMSKEKFNKLKKEGKLEDTIYITKD